ncbi:MAG: hypothetical protein R2849_21450 [Thermomicrobiales bacterium]
MDEHGESVDGLEAGVVVAAWDVGVRRQVRSQAMASSGNRLKKSWPTGASSPAEAVAPGRLSEVLLLSNNAVGAAFSRSPD